MIRRPPRSTLDRSSAASDVYKRQPLHVAVKIRLKRMGKIRAPFYRVVVMDSRTKRDGRAIEEIGKYHPTEEPSLCLLYTSPSPRDRTRSRMPSSA